MHVSLHSCYSDTVLTCPWNTSISIERRTLCWNIAYNINRTSAILYPLLSFHVHVRCCVAVYLSQPVLILVGKLPNVSANVQRVRVFMDTNFSWMPETMTSTVLNSSLRWGYVNGITYNPKKLSSYKMLVLSPQLIVMNLFELKEHLS